jgi:hypothetical protein
MRLRLLTVSLVAAAAACGGSPTDPTPALRGADVPTGLTPLFDIVVDPGNPDRLTYTFDELDPQSCVPFAQTSGLYEDLVFPSPVFLVPCMTANGTVGLMPSDFFGGSVEVRVQLPAPASVVSIESYLFDPGNAPTLIAYDANGTELGRASDATLDAWATLTVQASGTSIAEIGLSMPQLVVHLDNLTVDYGTGDPEPDPDPDPDDPTDPTEKADCLNGGWEAFGFANQGQCVRFVETGGDSR